MALCICCAVPFESQRLVDDAGKDVADWPEKVQQYILELKEETVFGRSDPSATSSLEQVQY
jgi:hypothetical protein